MSALPYRALLDPEIVEWVDALNKLPHVITWQSCAGHFPGERSRAGERYPDGCLGLLWFTLTPRAQNRFERLAGDLRDPIESVSVLYGREVVPVWEIRFQGRREGRLGASCNLIYDVLEYRSGGAA